RPWRVDFTRPDVVEHPETRRAASPTVAERLVLMLGLAYLFLAALTSGLAYSGYFFASGAMKDGENPDKDPETPRPETPPADPLPRRPKRHSDAPGLHTRPDGSRYLVMPLPADIADRFRGHTSATPAVIGGGAL